MRVEQVAGERQHAHAGDDADGEWHGIGPDDVVDVVERERRGIGCQRQGNAQAG